MDIIKKWGVTSVLFLVTAVLLTACGGGGGSSSPNVAPTVTPTVTSTSPINVATYVPINSTISATFSEAMTLSQPASATFKVAPSAGGSTVLGKVSFNSLGWTFTPSANLAPSTAYTAIITGAVASNGVAMASPYTWSFTTTGGFIYSGDANNGSVSSWGFSAGILSSTALSTSGAGGALSVAVDPSGNYLYSANYNNGSLSSYSVTGGLVSSAPITTTTSISGSAPLNIAVDPSGKFLYETDYNTGSVWSYSITNGALSTNPVSTVHDTNLGPNSIVVDPTGAYVYVARNSEFGDYGVASYATSNGTLTYAGSASDPNATNLNDQPNSMVQSGNFLFVAGAGYGYIASYKITGGALTYTTEIPFQYAPSDTDFLAADPSGKYLYVAEVNGGVILTYSIGANNGTLTLLSTTNATGASPMYIAVGPTGNHLYVTDKSSGYLSSYSITNGFLSFVSQSVSGLSGGGSSIAVAP